MRKKWKLMSVLRFLNNMKNCFLDSKRSEFNAKKFLCFPYDIQWQPFINERRVKKDLSIGRNRSCAYTDIYLSNIFSYQKSYHLVEPFLNQDFFPSASARCNVVKVLLSSRAFTRKCNFCSLEESDILSHQLFFCKNVENYRRLLRSILALYNKRL